MQGIFVSHGRQNSPYNGGKSGSGHVRDGALLLDDFDTSRRYGALLQMSPDANRSAGRYPGVTGSEYGAMRLRCAP